MFTIVGLLIVFGAVLGGYTMASGPLHVLNQPSEFVIIGGAALGTMLIKAPGPLRGQVLRSIAASFQSIAPAKTDYLELLKLQYHVFQFMRKNGAVALDEHVQNMEKSAIFSKYPSFLKRHEPVEFFRDALKQIVNGTATAEELDVMLDAELETHHEEMAAPINVINNTADALPGLGIVAAVLGIVITMGHLDAGPEEIGHHIGAALIGTFLGILLCYGFLQPLAMNVEAQNASAAKYMRCIKDGVVAALRGASPIVAIEFARKAIFSSVRPTGEEVDEACRSIKVGEGA
jgi:chemotaxis protein MotA